MRPLLALSLLLVLTGCGTGRVIISTGTTIGLKATPGDGTRPPQVTFGYKRAEASIVPTRGEAVSGDTDAFSTLVAFHFQTQFFGKTELDSFISTGGAARDIQQEGSAFTRQIAQVARAETFRVNNRAQLAAVERIIETYRRISDQGKRDSVRQRAEQLGLVPAGTSDTAFAGGKLQDVAVGGLRPITDKLQELESFTATVVAR